MPPVNHVPVPRSQGEVNAITNARTFVILGGILSAIVLLPTVPYVWLGIGAVLVPMVWVKTGKHKRAVMEAAGCSTKEQWRAFYNTLPTDKEFKQQQAEQARGTAGTALAAMAHAESSPRTRTVVNTRAPRAQSTKPWVSPPRPELHYPRYNLLSSGYANVEVVGEAYRETSVIAALGGLSPDVEKTLDEVLAFLIPEPENPHGHGNAIMVWMNGHHVGYLANEDAKRYRPVLAQIIDAGYLPITTGRLWGVSRYSWDNKLKHHLYARVALNEPEKLIPTNDPPRSSYSMLPWGNAIQVTKEADHLPELTEHLNGPDSYAIATLRPATKTLKNGNIREYVTVHIDGDEIGELTPVTSEKLLPMIRHLNDLEHEAAAWARVKGSALAVEVTIQASKAHEIPESWLAEIPVVIPSLHALPAAADTASTESDRPSPSQLTAREREENWDF
ncbi:hypothetical protein [Leucobacter salsicius]|uniref:hypothetical protein n=1 Tax=Leucobacter salsicius TaxID=664638 RepID=UPI00034CE450|nr:hypothetical protein [Leucobacter salsicius]